VPRDFAVKSHFRSPRQRPQQVRLAQKPPKPHTLRLYAGCGQASFARNVSCESEARPRPISPA